MTLEQYIKAIQKQAGNAEVVQLKNSDGSLSEPMPVRVAAEYLYNGTKPTTKTMPSEKNQMYPDQDIKRINEKAKAKSSNENVANFYKHGVLPALTFGISELITNGDPRTMSLSAAEGIGLKALSKSYWPIALGAAALNLYTSTHEPPNISFPQFGTRDLSTVPTQSNISGTDTGSGNTTSPTSPEPEGGNNKKKSRLFWETQKNSPNSSRIGRGLRNFGLRIPIYGTAANWGIPTVGNTFSFINTGKTPIKWPLTSYIFGSFNTDSIPNQNMRLVPVNINGQTYYIDPNQNTLNTTQQTDSLSIKAINQNIAETDSLDF